MKYENQRCSKVEPLCANSVRVFPLLCYGILVNNSEWNAMEHEILCCLQDCATKQCVRRRDDFQALMFSYKVAVIHRETGAHGLFQNSRKPIINLNNTS